MLFFLRCFFRLEWGDGGGSSLGLEPSTSAEPLAGEGRIGEVWAEGEWGFSIVLSSAPRRATLKCSWATLGEQPARLSGGEVGRGECRRVRQDRRKARQKCWLLQPGGVRGGLGNS